MATPDLNPPDRVREILGELEQTRDLEGVCARCGDCCSFAFMLYTPLGLRRYRVPDLPCRFLEPEGGRTRCTVYEARADNAPWCGKSLAGQLTRGVCSSRCGYIEDVDRFQVSEVFPDDQLAIVIEEVLQSVESKEHTLDPEAVRRFRKRWQVPPPLR